MNKQPLLVRCILGPNAFQHWAESILFSILARVGSLSTHSFISPKFQKIRIEPSILSL